MFCAIPTEVYGVSSVLSAPSRVDLSQRIYFLLNFFIPTFFGFFRRNFLFQIFSIKRQFYKFGGIFNGFFEAHSTREFSFCGIEFGCKLATITNRTAPKLKSHQNKHQTIREFNQKRRVLIWSNGFYVFPSKNWYGRKLKKNHQIDIWRIESVFFQARRAYLRDKFRNQKNCCFLRLRAFLSCVPNDFVLFLLLSPRFSRFTRFSRFSLDSLVSVLSIWHSRKTLPNIFESIKKARRTQ